jgi:hypothetical protein
MRGPGYTISQANSPPKLRDIVESAEFVVKVSQEAIDSGYMTHDEKIAAAATATAFNWFAMSLKGLFTNDELVRDTDS